MREQILEHQTFDRERALYGSRGLTVRHCAFDGPGGRGERFQGERGHHGGGLLFQPALSFLGTSAGWPSGRSQMTELCRAALWYSDHIEIRDSGLHGIKALRECDHASFKNCDIVSPEFGWSARDVKMEDCTAESEYFFLRGERLDFRGVSFKGKYSFQYVRDGVFDRCVF